MRRGIQGTERVVTTVGDEPFAAFIPSPLPPKPPIDLGPGLHDAMDRAMAALGRLDAVSTILPDPHLFIYSYVRKEAVLSSQIEGTQSSFSQLLLFEMDVAPGVPIDDVTEVSNYVAALDHGLKRVRGGFPISSRLLREMHAKLLSSGRGANKQPGTFRRSQNWIGGTRPGNATFVPPPWEHVEDCMGELERFLHDEDRRTPTLIKAALAHVQFETIHPFLDGNGRVGRLLIALILAAEGILREPLLYLSLYLKQHRSRYYELLGTTRETGDWEAWLEFFAEGVAETAEQAVDSAKGLTALFVRDRARVREASGQSSGSTLQVLDELCRRPVATIKYLSMQTGLSVPTVSRAVDRLVGLGIAEEVSGRSWRRIYTYAEYVKRLNEGTQSPL